MTIKRKYEKKEHCKKKDTCYDKNERYREGNREANRTTTRYKRDKDRINTKRREWRKQKKEEQLLINQ